MCISYSEFDLFRYFFILHYYCPHSKYNHAEETCCKVSKYSILAHVVAIFFLFLSILFYLIYLPEVCQKQQSLCIIFVGDEIFVFGAVALSLIFCITVKSQKREFEAWLSIFENRDSYNLDTIVSQRNLKFKFYRFFSVGIPVVFQCSAIIYFFVSYDKLPWSTVRKIVLSFAYAFHVKRASDMVKTISLVGKTLEAFVRSVKTTLTERLATDEDGVDVFKVFHKLIRHINSSIGLVMKTMTVILYLWSTVVVILLIINIYILIKYADYSFTTMCLLHLRTTLTAAGILTVLIRSEEDINVNVSGLDNFR